MKLKKTDAIRCRECGHRVLFKKRTSKRQPLEHANNQRAQFVHQLSCVLTREAHMLYLPCAAALPLSVGLSSVPISVSLAHSSIQRCNVI